MSVDISFADQPPWERALHWAALVPRLKYLQVMQHEAHEGPVLLSTILSSDRCRGTDCNRIWNLFPAAYTQADEEQVLLDTIFGRQLFSHS
jgi:hypothetical protein